MEMGCGLKLSLCGVLLLCWIQGGLAQFGTPATEISRNQRTRVEPEEGTCGQGKSKSVRYHGRYIECAANACRRTYPRDYNATTYITDSVIFEPTKCQFDAGFKTPDEYYDLKRQADDAYENSAFENPPPGQIGAHPVDDIAPNVPWEPTQCWYSFRKPAVIGQQGTIYSTETYTMEVTPSLGNRPGTLLFIQSIGFELHLRASPTAGNLAVVINVAGNEKTGQGWQIPQGFKTHIGLQIDYSRGPQSSSSVSMAALFLNGTLQLPVVRQMSKFRRRKREVSGERGFAFRVGAPQTISTVSIFGCKAMSISECIPVADVLGPIVSYIGRQSIEALKRIPAVCPDFEEAALLFGCSIAAPPCTRSERSVLVCRSHCDDLAKNCPEVFGLFGLTVNYCLQLPSSGCVNTTYVPEYGLYRGQIHSVQLYDDILSNREMAALVNGSLPPAEPDTECLCPADFPSLYAINSSRCVPQGEANSMQPRYISRMSGTNYYPAHNAVDRSLETSWITAPGVEEVSLVVSFSTLTFVDSFNLYLETVPPTRGVWVHTKSYLTDDDWLLTAIISHNCTDLGYQAYYAEHPPTQVTCLENPGWRYSYSRGQGIQLFRTNNAQSHFLFRPMGAGSYKSYENTLDWIDNDYLAFLLSSELKFTFSGLPLNVSVVPGGSSTDKYHSVNSAQVYGWQYDQSTCNCHPLGVADRADRCDMEGNCLCRRGSSMAKGKFQCVPYIDYIVPPVGPVSGGTDILIWGGYFGTINGSVTVSLGDVDLVVISNNDTLIHAVTPNLTAIYPNYVVLLDQPLKPIIRTEEGNLIDYPSNRSFTFKPDPIIEKVEPLSTFLRGGIIQTVTGQHLDSVFVPRLQVTVKFQESLFEQTATACTVVNSTTYLCPSPDIVNVPPNFYSRRRKRETGPAAGKLNVPNYTEFYLGFILDGVETYKNVSEVLPEYGVIDVFSNPVFARFDPETQVFKPDTDTYIEIEGNNMNYGCELKDYNVTIGTGICEVVNLRTNLLSCRAPPTKPELNKYSDDDNPRVVAKVGNIDFVVGYLRYQETLWDNPEFRTGIIAGICALLIIIIIIIVVICVIKRRKKPPYDLGRKAGHFENDYIGMKAGPMVKRPLLDLVEDSLRQDIQSLSVEPSYMTLGEALGKGNFGMVYSGDLTVPNTPPQRVAIKTIKGVELSTEEKIEFLQEATIMKDFNNENVLGLIAICIKDEQPYVVMPIMENGDLKTYISSGRNNFTIQDLLLFGLQVAKGMAYLAERKFIHRDLAARNCMVNKERVIKVADFGLARDIYEKDYYKVQDTQRPLPVKWMSIESLEGHKFSSASDVWSYGVLLWELLTRGQKPYADVSNHEMKEYLALGRRLNKPSLAPEEIYEIMLSCWRDAPNQRPLFRDIVRHLQDLLNLPGTEAAAVRNGDDGYLSPRENTQHSGDYLILLATEAPAPYGSEEGYLPMGGSVT